MQLTEELKALVLSGAMAAISAKTIRENSGNLWDGDRAVYETIVHAQDYLYDQENPPAKGSAVKHAMDIISAAKVQCVAEGWGAHFPIDQAWSQSELQRLLDIN